MDSETRSQLLQLQEMLHAPDQNLANILRRAIVVASLLGKHEYRFLFEAHLSGFYDEGAPKFRSYPGGYKPEIDVGVALFHDRRVKGGKMFAAPIETLEIIDARTRAEMSSMNAAELGQLLYSMQDSILCIPRIRTRVSLFVASALSATSTVQRATDSLTGLLTYDEYSKDLETCLQRSNEHISVAFGDMDNLKELNKKITHEGADKVLRKIAQILTETLLNRGTPYRRRNGDEFLVILENHTAAEAALLMERVRQRVAEHDFEQGLTPGSITISVGIVEHDVHATGAEALNEASVRANQAAKDAGKNCVLVLPITEPDPAP